MVALAGQLRAQPAERIPTFEAPKRFNVAYSYSTGVAAADIITTPSGGYPELAVCTNGFDMRDGTFDPNVLDGRVIIYQNTGDWSTPTSGLQAVQELSLGDYTAPHAVAFVDINGDQKLDLVVTSQHRPQSDDPFIPGNPGVYVFMADPVTGAFSDLTRRYVVETPINSLARGTMGLAIADLDNDGWPEGMAASDSYDPYMDGHEAVYVLKNISDVTYGRKLILDHVELPAVVDPPPVRHAVVIANFNRLDPSDGPRLDAVAGSPYGSTRLGNYRNTGNLDFTVTEIIPPTNGDYVFWDLATARLNTGSNAQDDVVGIYAHFLKVLHGNGDGTFTHNPLDSTNGGDVYRLRDDLLAPNTATATTSGHLNGGTKADVAAAVWDESLAHILLSKGNGKLQYSGVDARYNIPLHTVEQAPLNPGRIIIADMDQDGFGDLVVTSNGKADENKSVVVVLINKFELIIGGP